MNLAAEVEWAPTPIPIDQLRPSPSNVRTMPATAQERKQLLESIRNQGLLKNLVVFPTEETDDAGNTIYEVDDGARTFEVLKDLVGEGALDCGIRIPCRVNTDPSRREILSITANDVRVPMHPMEAAEAFAGLRAQGLSIARIATHLAVDELVVRRRLRLASLAEPIKDAFRRKLLTLSQAEAFASTDDADHQVHVWNLVTHNADPDALEHLDLEHSLDPHEIRSMLSEGRLPATNRVVRFLGRQAIEDAGLRITDDLFSETDDTWTVDDPAAVRNLGLERLQHEADRIKATSGWSWAKATLAPASLTSKYQRISREWAPLAPEAQQRVDDAHVRLAEIESTDTPTEEQAREAQALRQTITSIENDPKRATVFPDDAYARAGVIVTLAHDGTVQSLEGYHDPRAPTPGTDTASGAPAVPPQDGDPAHKRTASATGTPPAAPRDAAPPPPRGGISQALYDDMRAIRATELRNRLARDFPLSFDIATFHLVRSLRTPGHYWDGPLGILVQPPARTRSRRWTEGAFERWNAMERSLDTFDGLDLSWADITDREESFRALRAIPLAKRKRLFCACMAFLVPEQCATDPDRKDEIEVAVDASRIDFAKILPTTRDGMWNQMTHSQLCTVGGNLFGTDWAEQHRKLGKAKVTGTLESIFRDAPADSPAKGWTPPGMAPFDDTPITRTPSTTPTADAASTSRDTDASSAATPAPINEDPKNLPEFMKVS